MIRLYLSVFLLLCLIGSSGCLCSPCTWRACDVVDDVSDQQLCLDDCYDPTHDISRGRMPDWNCKVCNRKLSQKGQTCECQQSQQIWYPSEYRTLYQQKLTADQLKQQTPLPTPE